jgi:AcrR family transcriptional regulator
VPPRPTSRATADGSPRHYSSPLRAEQAQRTRDLVLDAFTDLLEDRRADDITTREIGQRAGVSQPTVYRHFPDRTALLEGLSGRIGQKMGMPGPIPVSRTADDLGARIEAMFRGADDVAVEVRAEVLLNSDPRWYAEQTRRTSAAFQAAVADAFPELDGRRHAQIAGLLRCLGSSHSWLRMREEFGVPGTESGPMTRWAMELILAAVQRGELPDLPDLPAPTGSDTPQKDTP